MENFGEYNCPIEIAHLIFKYLDLKTLSNCMLVSKKWKYLAEYTIERFKLWYDMVRKVMVNKGSSFLNKSTLDLKNIFRNFILYHHVKMSEIQNLKVYKMDTVSVKKMNVYKDNLIVVTNSGILYYDIKNYKLMKSYERSCIDFDENDYSVVELVEEHNHVSPVMRNFSQRLHLYRKCDYDEFELDPMNRNTVKHVRSYRLENESCYVITAKNILWRLINKGNRWEMVFIARHYGSDYDPLTTIHVANDLIYVVTKLGFVWFAETTLLRFVKVYELKVPSNISQYNWTMFDTFSCAVSVNMLESDQERVKISYDSEKDAKMLECSEMTCALEHGDILFLGFSDGRVEIRLPKKNSPYETEPERYFNIQQFLRDETDYPILGLNVCEVENAHILFVRTRCEVHQLKISYPEALL